MGFPFLRTWRQVQNWNKGETPPTRSEPPQAFIRGDLVASLQTPLQRYKQDFKYVLLPLDRRGPFQNSSIRHSTRTDFHFWACSFVTSPKTTPHSNSFAFLTCFFQVFFESTRPGQLTGAFGTLLTYLPSLCAISLFLTVCLTAQAKGE